MSLKPLPGDFRACQHESKFGLFCPDCVAGIQAQLSQQAREVEAMREVEKAARGVVASTHGYENFADPDHVAMLQEALAQLDGGKK